MFCDKTIITERESREKLVPVMTYVYGLSRPKAISATLSFISMCHEACSGNVRLPGILAAEDETPCIPLLDEVINAYIGVENLPKTTQDKLARMAYKIIKKLHGESLDFLHGRFIEICGEHSYVSYWKKFEQSPCFNDISSLMDPALGAMQRKRFVDFSIFFIAFIFLYGSGDAFYGRLASLEEKVKVKYGNGFPSDRLSLCLWPLDFSFVQDGQETRGECDEHRALLGAARAINPDVKVQVCADSLLWSRDIIAWLTDDYDVYAKSANRYDCTQFGRGALNEGGNIVAGTSREKFVLIGEEPLSDISISVDFHYEMFNRDISVYTLPGGFLWSRDPETRKDFVLDSVHIDSVINVVPAGCTIDGRLKVIVDPCYYAVIKNNECFMRFLKDQTVPDSDIVIVDDREQYLNLPNFSVLLNPEGERKLLFNKDKGHTIPRLNLKTGVLVQPAIEIVKMASSYGSIRCATAMLPLSYVKDGGPLKIAVSKKFLPETDKKLRDMFHRGTHHARVLSKLWVSKINVLVGRKGNTWEFDDFSRTAYFSLTHAQAVDPEKAVRAVNDLTAALGGELGRRLGIGLEEGAA